MKEQEQSFFCDCVVSVSRSSIRKEKKNNWRCFPSNCKGRWWWWLTYFINYAFWPRELRFQGQISQWRRYQRSVCLWECILSSSPSLSTRCGLTQSPTKAFVVSFFGLKKATNHSLTSALFLFHEHEHEHVASTVKVQRFNSN